MLDRSQLLAQLHKLADAIFVEDAPAYDLVFKVWNQIAADPTFIYKVRQAQAPWPVPTWNGNLNDVKAIEKNKSTYTVVAVDGSQIYPDRHQGLACYLVNVGGVRLSYGSELKPVFFYSNPYVFSGNDEQSVDYSAEMVNCKRQELELNEGVRFASMTQLETTEPLLLLFDGSLIFWHLEAKDMRLKEIFLSTYLASLLQLYQKRILTASYISMPKSRELINLVRLSLCNFDTTQSQLYEPVDRLVDTAIAWNILEDGQRTIVFTNHAHISDSYPEIIRPHFFYLHVGSEIGRVEIPAWVARDEALIDTVAQIVYDQCQKGRGYPVALAESHEQAVVKGPDRDFFYHVIAKIGFERNRRMPVSQKVIKKRGLGI